MQVFELHFNPKAKKDVIFDTFYYEPENVYEKRLGYLFLAGELINVLPSQQRFLKNLAQTIKTKFYGFKKNQPATALKNTLKETNEFLQKIAKKGDVSWISNLNFAILNLHSKKRVGDKKKFPKYRLNFTKVGNIEIFLVRTGKVLDIGQNLKIEEIEPYPLKIFFNIAFGNLEQKDRILIMNQEVAEIFVNQEITEKIALLPFLEEKKLNEILNEVKKDITGICLLIGLEKESGFAKITAGKERKKIQLPKIPLPKIKLPSFFGKFKDIRWPKDIGCLKGKKKNINLILAFIFLLVLGAGWAKIEQNKEKALIKTSLELAQEKINEAETLLILNQEQKANELFLQALQEIEPFFITKGILEQEINQMKANIENQLFDLNKMVVIEEPELIYQFPPHHYNDGGFLPEKMIFFQNKLYFFSPYFENIYQLDGKKISIIAIDKKFNEAFVINNNILFFLKPNSIFVLKNSNLEQPIFLESNLNNLELENIACFRSNLYFLDKNKGEIIRFRHIRDFEWQKAESWLYEPNENIKNADSMIVDGGIWILREKNTIDRYYAGQLQKTLEIKIFPFCEKASKIWAAPTLPYLYVLEPIQKRIVILDKQGQIVKQFQSEKFDNLKDFAVSENGKAIYLLNGSSVYLIKFNNED